MDNLKTHTIRGGIAKLGGQGASLLLRVGSLAVLARLLSPGDFGIVAMMMVITGLLDILSTAGLSPAMIQSATISDQQRANLFWINLTCGVVLGMACAASGPAVAELLRGASPDVGCTCLRVYLSGEQHRRTALRPYPTPVALHYDDQCRGSRKFANAAVAILFAWLGAGYWALIYGLVAQSLVMTSAFWLATGWIPGLPRRDAPVGPLLRFGATVTLNNLIVFLSYNAEKFLIGRFWGAAALGIYGRAYQLINLPTASIHAAVSGVALSSLSRLQDDPERQRHYFLKGYSLLTSLTGPQRSLVRYSARI